jgi:hypothetical protein
LWGYHRRGSPKPGRWRCCVLLRPGREIKQLAPRRRPYVGTAKPGRQSCAEKPHPAADWQKLRLAVINLYDPDGWTCADFPPAQGETPVGGGVFIKQHCEKHTPGCDLMVEAHFLRKPGQSETNPATGECESWTRFELTDSRYKKP